MGAIAESGTGLGEATCRRNRVKKVLAAESSFVESRLRSEKGAQLRIHGCGAGRLRFAHSLLRVLRRTDYC